MCNSWRSRHCTPQKFKINPRARIQVIMKVMWNRAFFLIILVFSLSACQSVSQVEPTPFRPQPALSTPIPTSQPTANPAPTNPPPVSACTDVLVFVDDITIPDGTQVEPGETLDKRWKVRNDGTCNWEEGYALRLISGPAMGVPEIQALYPARSGTEAVIRMQFNAPSEPGQYRTAWQAYNPSGDRFGDPFFMEIVVP